MKKTSITALSLLFFIAALLTSCSSANKATSGGVSASASMIKGNWTVNDIDIEGAEKSKVKISVFDDGNYACFIGSQWNLVQNGNGTYSISASADGCSAGVRTIYWSLQNNGGTQYFLFKKLLNGEKPKTVEDGYRLTMKSIDASSMVLTSAVDFDGKTIYINYHFSK